MGVLTGKDLLNSKFITAIIIDSSNRAFFVPIKAVLGPFFVADIEGDLYVFKIDGQRELIYRHSLVKSFRFLVYYTDHYLPISKMNNELEILLKENSLPRVNNMLLDVFSFLGKKEKREEFKAHDLIELMGQLQKHKEGNEERVRNVISYLQSLDMKQIVLPVKKISEFLEDDLRTTDPQFLGELLSRYQRTDIEHKKITNTPITGKTSWIKIMLVVAIVGLIGTIGYIGYDSGAFDSFTGMFSGVSDFQFPTAPPSLGGPANTEDISKKYPTPEALKAAIDRGEVNYNTLPDFMKKQVDNVKLPEAVPIGPAPNPLSEGN